MKKNIKTLYADALDVVTELGIEVRKITNVTWNTRLRSVWGRCFRNRLVGTEYTYRIELNPILADEEVSWEDAMDTMIHEILHAHEDRFCHTGEWKRCANLVNREYPIYNITRCTSAEEKNVADKMTRSCAYTVRCNGCGRENYYQRAGKVIKRIQAYPHSHGYKCGICGSTDLIVF